MNDIFVRVKWFKLKIWVQRANHHFSMNSLTLKDQGNLNIKAFEQRIKLAMEN